MSFVVKNFYITFHPFSSFKALDEQFIYMIEAYRNYNVNVLIYGLSITEITVKYAGNPMPIIKWHDEIGQEIPWNEWFQGYYAIFNNFSTTLRISKESLSSMFTLFAQIDKNMILSKLFYITSEGN